MAAIDAVRVEAAGVVGVNAWLLLGVAAFDDAAAGVVSNAEAVDEIAVVAVTRVEGITAVLMRKAGAPDGAGSGEMGNSRE